MSTVGLTKAMRRALEAAKCVCPLGRMYDALIRRGLITSNRTAFGFTHEITPRGHAALAAPRMTQAEYGGLKWLSTYIVRYATGHRLRMMRHLSSRGFANFDPFTGDASINDAGRTALNNVRAAMGSPDWKEGL